MSNPDERTAIDQFGTGDKCFGVTALMATLPGLPMFGHGQIEGYTEKYGMEYRWPRYQENPDPALVERHERQIAPLLHQRALFAESNNFLLYDFFREDGSVDENVFAYSNRRGDRRALVLYNNRYATTRGTVHASAAYADKSSGHLRQQRLKEGLDLRVDPALILACRDSLTGLEYLRRSVSMAEHGLSIELHAYQCHVFLDWRELRATAEQPWDRLCDELGGRGVADLEDALVRLELRPVHDSLRRLLEPAQVRHLAALAERAPAGPEKLKALELLREDYFQNAWKRCREFLREAQSAYLRRAAQFPATAPANPATLEEKFHDRVRAAMRIPALESLFPQSWPTAARRVLPSQSPQLTATALWGPVLAWSVLELLAESVDVPATGEPSLDSQRAALDLFDRLRLREPLANAFQALGFEAEESWRVAARIKVALLIEAGVFDAGEPVSLGEGPGIPQPLPAPAIPILSPDLWQDPDVRWLTGAHLVEGRSYFIKESYEELIWWLQLPALCKLAAQSLPTRSSIQQIHQRVAAAVETAALAGYRVDTLFQARNTGPEADSTASGSQVAGEEPDQAVPATSPEE
jgi:hypothetical protein